MPKRFTESEKWKGPWFHKLSPAGKLFYLYVHDQCDLAGFWEIDLERAVFDIGYPRRTLEGALKEVERCYETNSVYLWITQFIKSQGNFPFKEKNPACLQIIKLFKERESFSKNITGYLNGKDFPSPFEGGNKGLFSPLSNSKGIGKGQGISKGQGEDSKNQEAADFALTDQVIDYLNEKTDSSFKHSKASRENIHARLNGDGLSLDDCELLIDYKVAEWLDDPKTAEWLNPETLFRPTKWEKNLNGARRWDARGRPPVSDKSGRSGQLVNQRSLSEYVKEE